jgi:hypothetical protein
MEKNTKYIANLERIIRGAELSVWNVMKDLEHYVEDGDKAALDRALTNAKGEERYLYSQIELMGFGHSERWNELGKNSDE